MMKHLLTITALSVFCIGLFSSCTEGTKNEESNFISIIYDDAQLEDVKKALKNSDPVATAAFERLVAMTDSLYLDMQPLSVTQKNKYAPSNDPRDYITLSPYWWPDPEKRDGLPYIRRDGDRNPEVYDYPERENSGLFGEAVQALSFVYYMTGDEKYADKAASLLRYWFLDENTGMNPNMMFAQIIPGRKNIRGTGIIDARRFIYALNGAKMIEDSNAWSQDDRASLVEWAKVFLYWMEHSSFGQKELLAPNNHGLWYDAIRLMATAYIGDCEHIRDIASNSVTKRLASQIADDGSLPHELARTLGLHYSCFALEAASLSATIAKKCGYDLWAYKSADGKSMQFAIDYIFPYLMGKDEWPHMQIKRFETERGAVLLYDAGKALSNEEYLSAAHEIGYTAHSKKPDIQSVLYYNLDKK